MHQRDWIAAIEILVPNVHLPDDALLQLLRSCVPEQGITSMEEAQALLLRNFRVGGSRHDACARWLTDVTRGETHGVLECIPQPPVPWNVVHTGSPVFDPLLWGSPVDSIWYFVGYAQYNHLGMYKMMRAAKGSRT